MMALAFRNRYIRLTQASIFDPWVTKGKKYQYHIITKDISSEKVSMSDEKKDWGAAVTKFRELTADHEAKAQGVIVLNDGWVKEVSRNQKKSGAGKGDLGAYMALVEYCQSKDKYSKPIVSEK